MDIKLLNLITIAEEDESYRDLLEAVDSKAALKNLHNSHPAHLFRSLYAKLTIYQGPNGRILLLNLVRIVVPELTRQDILSMLHDHHLGPATMLASYARGYRRVCKQMSYLYSLLRTAIQDSPFESSSWFPSTREKFSYRMRC